MKPIQRNEVLPLGEYEAIRDRFRARVIAEKAHRRVVISDILSATFENRDTVLLQIQEMLRTERITAEAGIQHEIETYNDLIPNECELSMTLFVEIPEKELRDTMLVKLAGLERCVALEVAGKRFEAIGDRDGGREDRTTAVHYFKVRLDEDAAAKLATGAATALVVSHPAHSVRAELSAEQRRALAGDLAEPS
jgi:hypothetical protein